jgi:hypothetical protein
MSDARETRRRKFLYVFKLACEIATKKAVARNVVLVSRPICDGVAINCRTEGWGNTELRFYVRSDYTIFLVDELGEEVIVGVLDDDSVHDKIARAIGSKLPS